MIGRTIDQIHVGDAAQFSKTLAECDIYLYAGIVGDFNPVHINEHYAQKTYFKTRIAHGLLTAGLVSALLANKLPGPGTIYLRQEINFRAPATIGDTITAHVEVIEIMPEDHRVRFRTWCTKQDGTLILEGEALVSPPQRVKS